MGTGLQVTRRNTPDFFSRTRAYEDWEVFAAEDDDCALIGSAAVAVRDATVGGRIVRVGYELQYFTDPDRRRGGIASAIRDAIEQWLRERDVGLTYCLIMTGNTGSMSFFERHGFRRARVLQTATSAVFRRMAQAADDTVRSATRADLPAMAALIADTRRGAALAEPVTADALAAFCDRTPGIELEDFAVVEDGGTIAACGGAWRWYEVTEMIVRALSWRLRLIKLGLRAMGLFTAAPRAPSRGDRLRPVAVTRIGYSDPRYLRPLLAHINDEALARDAHQIACVSPPDHPLANAWDGFVTIRTDVHLFVKALRSGLELGVGPVSIDAIDL